MTWQPLVKSTPTRNGQPVDIGDEEFFENAEYQVHVRTISSERDDVPDMKHLSICRTDKQAVHDWRAFQRIKNELCGPEWEAVEIYPAESRLVDMANQYHLWCFQFQIGFGFSGRAVATPAQSSIISPASTQREFEPVDLAHGGPTPLKTLKQLIEASDYGTLKETHDRHQQDHHHLHGDAPHRRTDQRPARGDGALHGRPRRRLGDRHGDRRGAEPQGRRRTRRTRQRRHLLRGRHLRGDPRQPAGRGRLVPGGQPRGLPRGQGRRPARRHRARHDHEGRRDDLRHRHRDLPTHQGERMTSTRYEQVGGGTPDPDEQHEPRTFKRVQDAEGQLYMMSEIADGVFVQWLTCATCSKSVGECRCPGGPKEAQWLATSRETRFAHSFGRRGAMPPLPEALKQRDRTINAVMRELIEKGYTITPPAEKVEVKAPVVAEVSDEAATVEDDEVLEESGVNEALARARERAAQESEDVGF